MKKIFNITALFFIMAFYIFIPVKTISQHINTADLLPKLTLKEGLVDTTIKFNLNNGEWEGSLYLKAKIGRKETEIYKFALERKFIIQDNRVINTSDSSFGSFVISWMGLVRDTNLIKQKGYIEEKDGNLVLRFIAQDILAYEKIFELKDGEMVKITYNDFDEKTTETEVKFINVKKENGKIVSMTVQLVNDYYDPEFGGYVGNIKFQQYLTMKGEYDLTQAKPTNWLEAKLYKYYTIPVKLDNNQISTLKLNDIMVIYAHNGYLSKSYKSDNSIDAGDTAFFKYKYSKGEACGSGRVWVFKIGQRSKWDRLESYCLPLNISDSYISSNDRSGLDLDLCLGYQKLIQKPSNVIGIDGKNTGNGYDGRVIIVTGNDISKYSDGIAFTFNHINGDTNIAYEFQNGNFKYIVSSGSEHEITGVGTDTNFNELHIKMINKDSLLIESFEQESLEGKKFVTSFISEPYWRNEPSAIKEKTDNQFLKIFPNPASKKLTIESDVFLNLVVMYNTLGMKVWSGDFKDTKAEINVENFAAGIYFVRLYKSGDVVKIVIEK